MRNSDFKGVWARLLARRTTTGNRVNFFFLRNDDQGNIVSTAATDAAIFVEPRCSYKASVGENPLARNHSGM